MAKLMNVTRNDGTQVVNAYYIPVDRNFSKRHSTGHIVFQAWVDKASSKDLTKQPIAGSDIVYDISPTEYATYFADAVLKANDVDIGIQCYKYAVEKLDVEVTDNNGNKTMVSKFATATDDL